MDWVPFIPLALMTVAWLVALRAMHRWHREAIYWRHSARHWEQMSRKVVPLERIAR